VSKACSKGKGAQENQCLGNLLPGIKGGHLSVEASGRKKKKKEKKKKKKKKKRRKKKKKKEKKKMTGQETVPACFAGRDKWEEQL